MNVSLSKEHGFFTIWVIPATHNELCLSKVQNSIFERGANPNIVATRAAQQPGLLVRKHSARGGGRICTGMGLSKQHDKTHDINRNDMLFIMLYSTINKY
jgi:3-methyladenine DNA glycosylase Mpg